MIKIKKQKCTNFDKKMYADISQLSQWNEKLNENMINWLILMSCQSVWDYFMPWDYGIAFIVRLYINIIWVVVS